MSTLPSSTLEIPQRLQDSPQHSPEPQATARPTDSPSKKSVLVATLLSVGCVFIIIVCFTWWWKAERRRHREAGPLAARQSARLRQPQHKPEEQLEVKVVPKSSGSAETSSASLQRARMQNMVPEPRDNHSLHNYNAYNDSTPRHSRRSHTTGPMDIDVVTVAPSSPRLQPLSSVASVIDKYAQLPDSYSRLYSAGRQRYPSSVFNPSAGPSSRRNNLDEHDRNRSHRSPFRESPRASENSPLPGHHGLREYQSEHQIRASSSNRLVGAKAAAHEALPSKVDQLLGSSFGAPNPRTRPGESSIQPKHATASTYHRNSGYNANEILTRGEPSEEYRRASNTYDVTSSYSRSLSDISERKSPSGASLDNLQPVPLRILKTKSAQLSGQYNEASLHEHENVDLQRESLETNSQAEANSRLAAVDRYYGLESPDDLTAMNPPAEGTGLPGSRVERMEQEARIPSQPVTTTEQPYSDQQELPMSLTLSSVRRILGSSYGHRDPLDRHQRRNRGAGEADIQRWREQVVSDADTERERRRSDETIRSPPAHLMEDPEPEHVIRNTHVHDSRFDMHANETPPLDESRFQDTSRDSAESGNSTWTTATPSSFARGFF